MSTDTRQSTQKVRARIEARAEAAAGPKRKLRHDPRSSFRAPSYPASKPAVAAATPTTSQAHYVPRQPVAEIPSGPSRQPAYSLDKWQIGESTRETVLYLGGFVLFLASLPFVLFERVVDVDPWVGWLSFAGLVAAGLMVRAANKDKAR